MKRIASLILSLVMAFSLVIVSFGEVNAESKYYLAVPQVMWTNQPDSYGVTAGIIGTQNYYDPIKVTSSNSKVIRVSVNKYDGNKNYFIKARRPGKAVVKATIKLKSGSTKTIKTTITVKKYPAPVKSLKVNGKAVKLSTHKYQASKQTKGSKVSVKLVPKSGWKITYVYGTLYDKNWNGTDAKIKKSAIKKGTSISFPKNKSYMDIFVDLENSKGESFSYCIDYFR